MNKVNNRQSTRLLKEISEITHIGGWEIDLETMTPIWSDEVRAIHEVPSDYQPDLNDAINFYPLEARPILKAAVDRVLRDGGSYDLQLPFITAKGNRIWVRTTGRATFKNGKVVRLYGAFQDITQHKLEEQQIALNEQKFRNVFNYLGTGMALVSMEGNWLDVNPEVAKILGYTPAELFTMTFQDITYPDDLEKDLKNLNLLIAGEINSYEIEKRYIHKDGNLIWALLTVSLVRKPDGSPLFFISQIQDIMERKQMENALIENNQRLTVLTNQLTHQNNLLEQFNHIVSHNLRTPAGNMRLLLKFHDEAESDDERRELVDQMSISSDNLLEILNDLVDILKVKQSTDIETTVLTFEQVLNKTINMLSGLIREKEAIISCDFAAPQITYSRIYLESAMLNLLSNALKYSADTRKPAIAFKTFTHESSIVMEVSDNGMGINMEKYKDRIFQKEQTFHEHTDSKGLGLFMTRNQVESLGGAISVDSVEGEGSTFRIRF